MKTLLALTTLSALVSVASANPNAAPKNLPKEIQPMYCLVGEWKSQGGFAQIEGKKHKVDFTVSCAPVASGMAIGCTAKFDVEGMGHMEESDLFGYDAAQNRYHWFSVTSRGETHDHVALPPGPNDKSITFAYAGVQAGKPMQEVITLTFLDEQATKLDFKNVGTIAGQPAWLFGATMIKK